MKNRWGKYTTKNTRRQGKIHEFFLAGATTCGKGTERCQLGEKKEHGAKCFWRRKQSDKKAAEEESNVENKAKQSKYRKKERGDLERKETQR